MKLRWFWVGTEKVLRYSQDGVAWHDVPSEPAPVAFEITPEKVEAAANTVRSILQPSPRARARGLGPMGAAILTEAQAEDVRKPVAKRPAKASGKRR